MRDSRFQADCKIEQRERPFELPQSQFKSPFLMPFPFFPQFQAFPQNHQINSSPLFIKKRRSTNLRLKSQPSQQKMKKIDEKRGRYKRSTNNSHKKYTGVARRLLLKYLSQDDINRFQTAYESLKNSRTYYFIILAHVKFLLSGENKQEFQEHFMLLMNNKMNFYRKQIEKTSNRNFINFRLGEIAQIEYALRAFGLYFEGFVEQAVQIIYKKDKEIIIKKNQYTQTIQIIKKLEENLKARIIGEGKQTGKIKVNKFASQQRQQQINMAEGRDFHEGSISEEQNEISEKSDQQEDEKEKKEGKMQINSQEERKKTIFPLKGLENSYPLFESFYPIMFPYSENSFASGPSLSLIYSKMQFEQMEQQKKIAASSHMSAKTSMTKFQSFQSQPYIITARNPEIYKLKEEYVQN